MRRIGIGYRRPLDAWLSANQNLVNCLEITAEHFFDGGEAKLRQLAANWPIYVHGLGLSLATPGPLPRKLLRQFSRVARVADATWVSEHIAFTRTSEVDLGHLNAAPLTELSLATVAEHAAELRETCGRQVLLENVTSDLRIEGNYRETEFLNRLCDRARCGLLLDVTNLWINSRNHGFDPLLWLDELDPHSIVQLHVVGYTRRGERYLDFHADPIQQEVMDLVAEVVDRSPVQAIILERDERLEATDEIAKDLEQLHQRFAND